MSPSIDIIVPCYGYGHLLKECVNSVLCQEGVDLRVLIIDDCSPDNATEIALELVKQDNRVQFHKHNENQGHHKTYNEGLNWASAKYLLLLSADDMLTANALSRAVSIMEIHPQVNLVYGMAIRANSLPRTLPASNDIYTILTGIEFLEYTYRTLTNPVPTPTAVVRRTIQQLVGGYSPELPHTGDMEMWMRFAAHGDIGVVKACQALYRWHGQNMQMNYINNSTGDLAERLRTFESIADKYASKIPKLKVLAEKATRSIAEEAFWRASRLFEQGDLLGFQKCSKFAVMTDPQIAKTSSWFRLRLKSLCGYHAWTWFHHLQKNKRAQTKANPPLPQNAPIIGWWPEAAS